MQLQRILALAAVAVLGCAATTATALDFADVTTDRAATSDGDDQTDSLVENEQDRIYGGTEADITKYPWTVSLRKTAEGQTYCGGTLVAAQYIVTAAHCVKNTTYASIGSQFAIGGKDGERIKVTDQWVHPKYVKDTHVYDVAVMKLETPSTYKTLPLCKADGSQNKENAMAVVRGWGVTESEVPATTLLEVNVKIISNAICNKSYNNRITEQMICAGQGGGKDTCQGDSGGALISNNALVGIVSWGGACGEAPGVYVRVTSVLDFINEKIGGGAATSNSTDASGSGATVTPAASSATPAASSATPAASSAAPAMTITPSTAPAMTVTPSTAPATTVTPSTVAPEAGGSASQSTKKPATTTAAPAAGNSAPATTTAAPAVTTAAPAATTAAPAATTAAPPATTAAPAATTAAPAATTAAPAATTASPASGSAGKPTMPSGGSPDKSAGGKGTSAGKGTDASKPKKKDCGVRL